MDLQIAIVCIIININIINYHNNIHVFSAHICIYIYIYYTFILCMYVYYVHILIIYGFMMHALSTFQLHTYTLWNMLYVTVHVLEHSRLYSHAHEV